MSETLNNDSEQQLQTRLCRLADELSNKCASGQLQFLAIAAVHSDGKSSYDIEGMSDPATVLGCLEVIKTQALFRALMMGEAIADGMFAGEDDEGEQVEGC